MNVTLFAFLTLFIAGGSSWAADFVPHYRFPESTVELSYQRLNAEETRVWIRNSPSAEPTVLFEGPVSRASAKAGISSPISSVQRLHQTHTDFFSTALIQIRKGPTLEISADGSARALPPPIMKAAHEELIVHFEIHDTNEKVQFSILEWSSDKAHPANANHRIFVQDKETGRFKFLQRSELDRLLALTKDLKVELSRKNPSSVRQFNDPAQIEGLRKQLSAMKPEHSFVSLTVQGSPSASNRLLPSVEVQNLSYWVGDSVSKDLNNASRNILFPVALLPQGKKPSPSPASNPRRKLKTKDGKGEIDVFAYLDEHFQNWQLKDSAPLSVDPAKLDEIALNLMRTEAGSAVLTGEAGTGKTTLMKAFVQAVQKGQYPAIAPNTKFYFVDAASLGAGTSLVGVFEERVEVMKRANELEPIIWVVDEIHSLKGQGTSKYQSADFFQMIKSAMADGSFRILGSSTEDEFQSAFAGDRALMRRLSQVKIKAPEGEALFTILRGWIQKSHQSVATQAQLETIVQLSEIFQAEGSQPAKSIHFLDSMYAYLKLQNRGNEAPQDSDILQTAKRIYSADLAFISGSGWQEKLSAVERALEEQLIGNQAQRAALLRVMKNRLAGVQDPKRPAMTLLVGGRKGLGKTESLKILANSLQVPYVHIEMGKFGNAYNAPELLRREIAAALRKNPFSVINFDEIEKSSLEVQNALLSVFNEGEFVVSEQLGTDSTSISFVKMSARNAHFGATTNAGIDYLDSLSEPAFGFHQAKPKAFQLAQYREALTASGLSPYLVDRFDAVTFVVPPTQEEFRAVLSLHLNRIVSELSKSRQIEVKIQNFDAYLDQLVKTRYTENVSNREAIRAIREELTNEVADALLASGHVYGSKARIDLRLGRDCAKSLGAFLSAAAPTGT